MSIYAVLDVVIDDDAVEVRAVQDRVHVTLGHSGSVHVDTHTARAIASMLVAAADTADSHDSGIGP